MWCPSQHVTWMASDGETVLVTLAAKGTNYACVEALRLDVETDQWQRLWRKRAPSIRSPTGPDTGALAVDWRHDIWFCTTGALSAALDVSTHSIATGATLGHSVRVKRGPSSRLTGKTKTCGV